MYLAYSLLLTLGFAFLLPRFLLQALVHGKYVASFRERLGSLPALATGGRPVIWLHCVSVGETQAARPLVDRLRSEFPHYSLVVSTITQTGQTLARDVFRDRADAVFYFPLDWRWSARRAIARINPVAVLIMETELWPNFLQECQARRIPVALVNGRISRQSFRRYRLIKTFLARVFSSLRVAAMQSGADAERIQMLGMVTDRVFVTGNLKFDAETVPPSSTITQELRERFKLEKDVPLILAASTHAPEEEIVLESFHHLRSRQNPHTRLMLAPRHPERFQEVASLLQNSGLKWARRTDTPVESDVLADVILLDTIGELPATYSLASIVFVGGSIIDRGGHNVLEPAAAGACIVTGAYTHNFHAIVDLLSTGEAIIQLPPLETRAAANRLREVFGELLKNPERRTLLGDRARQLFADNRGATERTMQVIRPLLSVSTVGNTPADLSPSSNPTS